MHEVLPALPPPPAGKTGWPWTEVGDPRSGVRGRRTEDGPQTSETWPRLTVVTPSFNQGRFLEATIRSVLLQGYPNLEYMVIDGGSTDESVEVIRKYEPWLTYWVSEKDQGQAHAINKGMVRSTGEILAYLNSDDIYDEGALRRVGEHFVQTPECRLLVGATKLLTPDGASTDDVKRLKRIDLAYLAHGWRALPQLAAFWRSTVRKECGDFREDLHYALDREYFLRLWFRGIRPELIEDVLAMERRYPEQKGRDFDSMFREFAGVVRNYYRDEMGGVVRNVLAVYLYWRRHYVRKFGWRGAFHRFGSRAEEYGWRCLFGRGER